MVVIVYDICDEKRLNKVAKYLEQVGIRVQKSVFELPVSFAKGKKILKELSKIIDKNEDKCFLFELKDKEDICSKTSFEGVL